MEPLSYSLAFVAGVLTIFSPCVLPLVPMILGTAVSKHRLGPFVLTAGLVLSFLGVGLFVATLGFAVGLDSEKFRVMGASMLVVVGAVLLIPPVQARFALVAGPMAGWADRRWSGKEASGLAAQFTVGLLLGAVWSPCAGPTLGTASVLAAQSRDLLQVSATMLLFAVGVAVPLVAIGLLSREALMRWRGRMLATGKGGKLALGAVLLLTGVLLLSGWDKQVEAAALTFAPDWLVDVVTRY